MEDKTHKSNISIYNILYIIKSDQKKMIQFIIAFAIIGIIISFSIPKIYKAKVMLAPEIPNTSNLTSNMSSLASMIGMDMNFGNANDAIYPEIYPDLMGSMDFLFSLFPIQVHTIDGTINFSYYNYKLKFQKISWWYYPLKWFQSLFNNKGTSKDKKTYQNNAFEPSKEQYDIATSIEKDINCQVDKKTNVITIEVTAQDPLISAILADSVKEKLKSFITQYRTNKARNDLAYMEQLYKEAKMQYTQARLQYASYSDANEDLLLQSYKSKQEDLENEMQLRYNIYTQVVQQLQLSKAKVQEKTPVFTVLQSATVPIKHSNKPKILILLEFIFIGFCLRISILLYKKREELFQKDANCF